ncbi:hypothetical protein NE237_005178 [Protea cynaroides]|uniref:Uncharacterized protein n=1 Tax=Protea cynaroides TaxID=273540 RepID=A0A9Q0KKC1_9MAGN|nr:hypothetical protein NE237_005178 [Protea cynaroides]
MPVSSTQPYEAPPGAAFQQQESKGIGIGSPSTASQMPMSSHNQNNGACIEHLEIAINLPKSRGIITNTFASLDSKAIKAIAKGDCTPSVNQEIALGLERSGQRFLWVVRSPPKIDDSWVPSSDSDDFDLEALMPEGFLDRIRDRGLVVKSWAPQVEVLSKESVGRFVTHCGWNSVFEAMCTGVPMLAWLLYAEQHVNKVLLVEEMKLVTPMETAEEDGFVGAGEVQKRVRTLMDLEEGREIRERCWEMRKKALVAWAEGGSSWTALSNLANTWTT